MIYVTLLKARDLDKLIKTIVFMKHGIGAMHELDKSIINDGGNYDDRNDETRGNDNGGNESS